MTYYSNHEQVIMCLQCVSNKFEVHEDFAGLHIVDSIDARSCCSLFKLFYEVVLEVVHCSSYTQCITENIPSNKQS